ncbi:hypothetical protein GCM10010390_39490 [Streptomyces mordarskii]|uniref:Uncharacterized protein n=1 Tax=Streptomyces mordarskii TaxID=1226758 RepID=A0ABN1D501_9ACTN
MPPGVGSGRGRSTLRRSTENRLGTQELPQERLIRFPGLPEGLTVKEVVSLLGPLVRSPLHARSGVVPCELSGLAKRTVRQVVYASSMAEFHHLVRQVHERIQQG